MDVSAHVWQQIDALAAAHNLDRADVITGAIAIVAANPALLEEWLWDQPATLNEFDAEFDEPDVGTPAELEEVAHG